jgi:hypothetical protein
MFPLWNEKMPVQSTSDGRAGSAAGVSALDLKSIIRES